MTDSAIKQNKERVLPDERYNAKLFRQAYKAAKEAKEIDIKRKKKNALLKIVYFSLIPIVLGFSVSLFLRFRTVPIEYVESMKIGRASCRERV